MKFAVIGHNGAWLLETNSLGEARREHLRLKRRKVSNDLFATLESFEGEHESEEAADDAAEESQGTPPKIMLETEHHKS